MTDSLPKPTVTAEGTQEGTAHRIDVTVSREGAKTRTYTGVGSSPAGAARELVEKMLDDPTSAEFIRKG